MSTEEETQPAQPEAIASEPQMPSEPEADLSEPQMPSNPEAVASEPQASSAPEGLVQLSVKPRTTRPRSRAVSSAGTAVGFTS